MSGPGKKRLPVAQLAQPTQLQGNRAARSARARPSRSPSSAATSPPPRPAAPPASAAAGTPRGVQRGLSSPVFFWVHVFYLSKVYELGDTLRLSSSSAHAAAAPRLPPRRSVIAPGMSLAGESQALEEDEPGVGRPRSKRLRKHNSNVMGPEWVNE
jgi:hypothetical protein